MEYIESEDIQVADSRCFEISDNLEVGRHNRMQLADDVKLLDTSNVYAVLLATYAQLPSLPAVQRVEDAQGIAVTPAAICTPRRMLDHLELESVEEHWSADGIQIESVGGI